MNKHMLRFFMIGTVIVLVNGCSSTGVSVRSYVEDRPRVDQDLEGNTGFYSGKPREKVDVVERKKTRKVYVVEVSKEAVPEKQKKANVVQQEESAQEMSSNEEKINEVAIPAESAVVENPKSVVEYVEYTVEKDDTLQKVAKKFYGSYSKWIKIYEYNKQNIKDPDHIRPGTTLKIPQN